MIKSGTHFIFLMYLKRCLVETKRFCRITNAVSVLHQDEGGFGKSTPNAVEISRGLSSREISRAEGMDFPIPPEFWWSTDILSSSIFLQGVDQEDPPCGQGRIDSVKINPTLLTNFNKFITVSNDFVFLPFGKYPGAVFSLPFCNPTPVIYEPI